MLVGELLALRRHRVPAMPPAASPLDRPHVRRRGTIGRPLVGALLVAQMALAGCTTGSGGVDRSTTGSVGRPMTAADFQRSVSYWGGRYTRDPASKENALNYAAALRRVGNTAQAVAVLQKAAMRYSTDRDVLAAYGKALAANGQLDQALDAIRRAQTPDQPDWRLLSAEGAILDQMGQADAARAIYQKALAIKPNDPTVLSNLGMSYVLTNQLPEAENVLRVAIQQPGADSRIRQNLALVVGLQGRFAEAQQIARSELSPQQAEENVAYLQAMLARQRPASAGAQPMPPPA